MSKKWFRAAAIRAVRTVVQTLVSLIGVGAAMSDVDWPRVTSASLLAGLLSLLTSLAGLPEVDEGTVGKKERGGALPNEIIRH